MTPSDSQYLKEKALELGFDDVGIAHINGPLPFSNFVLEAKNKKLFGPLDYLYSSLDKRLDIRLFFPAAQAVIVVIKNYYTGDHPENINKNYMGKIARYAWGKDYHQWFKKRLRKFKFLAQEKWGSKSQFWLFNDTGPFLERSWAHKAGLGFIGKSSMFISRKFGTWTFIGGMATNLALIADAPYAGPDCGSCNRCIDACPTGAIESPHSVNASKCISTWTIERPLHTLAKTQAPRNHEWAFGCDICQEVCPWNKFEQITQEPRFILQDNRNFLSLDIFKQDLAGSPLYRARKSGLLANFLRIRKSLNNLNKR